MPDVATVQLRAVGYALGDVHWKAEDGVHIGVYEHHRNDSPRIREILRTAGITVPAAWCMAIVYDWIRKACRDFNLANPLDAVVHKALVQSMVDWAIENDRIIGRGDRIPGDIVAYSFARRGVEPEDTPYNHTGLVVSAQPFTAVEGNTFLDDGDDDAPGDRGEREGYEVEVKDTRQFHYQKPTLFIRWADGILTEENNHG